MKRHLSHNTLLLATLDLGESLGLQRGDILDEIKLDESLAARPGAFVPVAAVINAIEYAAARTQRTDFGLQIADRRDHYNLGLFGLLVEQCDSVAEVHEYGDRFFKLRNDAIEFRLARERSRGVMRLHIDIHADYEPRHYVDALLALYVRTMSVVLGPRWRPAAVHFRHSQLASRSAYERRFGLGIKFGQKFDGVVLQLGDLDRQSVQRERNEETKLKLETLLRDSADGDGRELPVRVSRLVQMLLRSNGASIGRVAGILNTSSRSLQRRLLQSGTSFGRILVQTRAAMARHYLRKGDVTVVKLAPLLGFSDASAASRFLRTHVGKTANELKRESATS